ncbi:hypothetical protein GCM10009558_014730 [Virgisporangium aurantiacum]
MHEGEDHVADPADPAQPGRSHLDAGESAVVGVRLGRTPEPWRPDPGEPVLQSEDETPLEDYAGSSAGPARTPG